MNRSTVALTRYTIALVFLSLVVALMVAREALAATDVTPAQLATQYATWAGGRDNSHAIVNGLTQGRTVTLSPRGRGGVSLAGFSPAPMSVEEAAAAMAQARAELARAGIAKPTAEQMQAAFAGGEVRTTSGRMRTLQGISAPRAAQSTPVAAR